MSTIGSRFSGWAPYLLSLLRAVSGFLFLQHGLQKVFGMLNPQFPQPALMSQMGISGLLELVGGALLILGLFTRFTAFILSGEMAVAYFQAHAPKGPWPINNGGELAALFSFVFLYIAAAGPGPLSVDAKIRKRH